MSKVLVISGHPSLENSYTNKLILNSLASNNDNIEIRQLDKLYPTYQINIEAEQNALLKADVVVLQYPYYWYSMPALLKKWLDDVFCYGFAYGSTGDKLQGKKLVHSFTIGGPMDSYNADGYNEFTIEQMMLPQIRTANLAGMDLQTPVYTHGMIYIPGIHNSQERVEQLALDHSQRLQHTLEQLCA